MQSFDLLVLFLLAIFSFWAAGVAGMSMQLDPLTLTLVVTAGYTLSVIGLIVLGAPLRDRLLKGRAGLNPNSAFARIVNRYGVVGLGLAAPMLTGATVGAALGLALNMPPRRLCLWMALGAAAWSLLLLIPALL